VTNASSNCDISKGVKKHHISILVESEFFEEVATVHVDSGRNLLIEEVGCSNHRNSQGNFSLNVLGQENGFLQFNAPLFTLVEKNLKVEFIYVIHSHRYVDEHFLPEITFGLGIAAQEVNFDKVHINFWHNMQSVAEAL